jgi:hypothetical protein
MLPEEAARGHGLLRAMATHFDRVVGLDLDGGANIELSVRAREITTTTLIDLCDDPGRTV